MSKYKKRYLPSSNGAQAFPKPKLTGPPSDQSSVYNKDDSSAILALKEENMQLQRLNKELTGKVVKYKQQSSLIPELRAELAQVRSEVDQVQRQPEVERPQYYQTGRNNDMYRGAATYDPLRRPNP